MNRTKKNLQMIVISFVCFTKRQLRQWPFLVLLLALPLGTFLLTRLIHTEPSTIRIALYAEQTDPTEETGKTTDSEMITTFLQKLIQGDHNFTYYICDSKETLYRDVATAYAECGYVIPTDLVTQLDHNKKNNLIEVVVSNTTTLSNVSNEVFYAALFEEYSLHLLQGYLTTDSELSDISPSDVEALYRRHLVDGSTFCFDYEISSSLESKNVQITDVVSTPIRGLLSLFILLAGCCGVLNYYDDQETHAFDHRNQMIKHGFQLLSIMIPVILISLTGLLCLLFLLRDCSHTILQEALALCFYDFLVILFCFLSGLLIQKKQIFCTFLPFLLIGCILFTPIFFDVTTFLPMLKPLSYLFLPYYYLSLGL